MHRTVGFRIPDDDEGLEDHDVFRMANLMGFTVGKPEHERLKRAPTQPFSEVFWTHTPSVPRWKTNGKRKHPLTIAVNGRFEVERKGVEPSTFALRTRQAPVASEVGKALTATPSPACTAACTSEAENANANPLDGDRATAADDIPADLDLAAIVAAWPSLPGAIRAGIVAMVNAAANAGEHRTKAGGKPKGRSKAKGTPKAR